MVEDHDEDTRDRRRSSDRAVENLRRENDYRFAAIEQRFVAQEAAVRAAESSAKEAVVIANLANEKRFDSLGRKFDGVYTKMETMTAFIERLSGKSSGISLTVGYMIAAATIIISLVIFFVNRSSS